MFSVQNLYPQAIDTLKILSLLDSSKKYFNSNPELSEEINNKCIILSKEYFYTRGLAKSFSNLGVLNFYRGDLTESISLFESSR